MDNINDLTEIIIGAAFKVHNNLGFGFLEKVYENALKIELSELNIDVKQQYPINVYYKNQIVGEYSADLIINDTLIIEIKAVNTMIKEHEVQLVNYLNATKINDGLLINFGKSVEVKRKYRIYNK